MKINEKLLVTNFIYPDAKFESQYGRIDGESWLKKERMRIGKCEIVRDKIGKMALQRIKAE